MQEDAFDELADAIFVGEAEETWPQFLREWQEGRHAARYEQAEKTDMTKVPIPRFDLLKMNRYLFGSLQFSRGCPFQCEFCDIIVTFGRRPRLKTSEQVIAELDAIRKAGMDVVFIVDDNLIGNKKAIKEVLRSVVAWQHKNGYPLTFFTEASIDLADDAELMELMVEANFIAVFIGIESPDEEALRETKKFQNVRKGGTLLEKVHRVQDAGMAVWCGMIMGFDSDDTGIFDRQIEFIQQARIPFSMSGMLHAIPKTPLYDRLLEDGRLDLTDPPEFGTNVRPLLMSPRGATRRLHPRARGAVRPRRTTSSGPRPCSFVPASMSATPAPATGKSVGSAGCVTRRFQLVQAIGLYFLLMRSVPSRSLREEYRHRFWKFLKYHKRPGLVVFYLVHLAMHFHAHTLATQNVSGKQRVVTSW